MDNIWPMGHGRPLAVETPKTAKFALGPTQHPSHWESENILILIII
jgi:hypothetical protein